VRERIVSHQDVNQELFRLLSNKKNLEILYALRSGPLNTRGLSKHLGMRESHVSSRLSVLLDKGLIKDEGWKRVQGKNVKLYSLNVTSWEVKLLPEGYQLKLKRKSDMSNLASHYYTAFDHRPPRTSFHFIGRKEHLRLLDSSNCCAVVWGLAGMGKTSLVAKYMHSRIPRNKPIFWHTFREMDSFSHLITKIAFMLYTLGRDSLLNLINSGVANESAKIDLAKRELAEIRSVMVFDDYHLCTDPLIQTLVRELIFVSGTRVFVISRTRPNDLVYRKGVTEIRLEGFSLEEAKRFLESRLGSKAKQVDLFNSTLSGLKGHPLALEIFCQSPVFKNEVTLEGQPIQDYVETEVFKVLNPEETTVLTCGSVFRKPVALEAYRIVTPATVLGVRKTLLSLERKGLVMRVAEKFFIHDLIRTSAYNRLENPSETHRLAAEYYLGLNGVNSRLEALYHAGISNDQERLVEIIRKDEGSFLDAGLASAYIATLDSLIKHVGPENARTRGWLLCSRGNAFSNAWGTLDRAIEDLEASLKLANSCGDRELVVRTMLYLGHVWTDRNDTVRAESYYKEGLKIASREQANQGLTANLKQSLAELFVVKDDYKHALKAYLDAARLQERLGNRRNALLARIRIALIHYWLGESEASLALLEELGDSVLDTKNYLLITGWNMGMALSLHDIGRKRDALEYFDSWVETAEKVTISKHLSEALSFRAINKAELGDLLGARTDLERASKLTESTEGETRGFLELALGVVAMREAKYEYALKCFSKSEALISNSKYYAAMLTRLKGEVELLRGNTRQALNQFKKAKDTFLEIGANKHVSKLQEIINTIRIKKAVHTVR
jgi:ATP/maltotriose-dependent transcriptional regulator MalT/DNA-binding transcriptional ArsR family regulator